MKPEEIFINDWQRIFIGDVPGAFYAEVVLRVAVIYLILMVAMRLMGKRMASQLSRNEMAAMVSLAAAIGVPLQSPDRGILAVVVIAGIVVFVQQLIARLASKNQRLEKITQGNVTPLIEDSRLNLQLMKRTGITRERVFAQLRCKRIRHLGEVKRLYFEAGGKFTLVKRHESVPGLPILPIWDQDFQLRISAISDKWVCSNCGQDRGMAQPTKCCENCEGASFIKAVE
ncbi:DUF421 domain-containing protein [Dyadobacter crusticola]|uniref:DUF421 domain-containing protein n=1 Tax=Dyadobacter crusticola TaxID=292407 RepID=UPI0004E0E839|nr:YetF domain-containing protein [Dyadobacter crusticola]